jgi:hypothetical protein
MKGIFGGKLAAMIGHVQRLDGTEFDGEHPIPGVATVYARLTQRPSPNVENEMRRKRGINRSSMQ